MNELSKEELKAVIFAVKADLEVVRNALDEFGRDEEILVSALKKLEDKK